ncbi:hypothetical protein Tco_0150102 [Tanacetum coccineum]
MGTPTQCCEIIGSDSAPAGRPFRFGRGGRGLEIPREGTDECVDDLIMVHGIDNGMELMGYRAESMGMRTLGNVIVKWYCRVGCSYKDFLSLYPKGIDGNGYSLKDKNDAKTDKTEHENGKSVKSQNQSQSQKVKVKVEAKDVCMDQPAPKLMGQSIASTSVSTA